MGSSSHNESGSIHGARARAIRICQLPEKVYEGRLADKSGKLQPTPSMFEPRWPHLYPQHQWSLWVCCIVVISLLHGTSCRHVDWLVGMMRLDEWNHTSDIAMDNTQLFRALHFANGGWQRALEMIEAHIKHNNPWCCCYGRSPWFRSFWCFSFLDAMDSNRDWSGFLHCSSQNRQSWSQ